MPKPIDIESASILLQILESLSRGDRSGAAEPSESDSEGAAPWFDEAQAPHLRALYDRILATLQDAPGYERSIIGAMCFSILCETNELLPSESNQMQRLLRQRLLGRRHGEQEIDLAGAAQTELHGDDGPAPRVVAFDGDWHWVRRTDLRDEDSQWVPAQRERGHWNSSAWRGIPMYQVEIGARIEYAPAANRQLQPLPVPLRQRPRLTLV